MEEKNVHIARMRQREKRNWEQAAKHKKSKNASRRMRRNASVLAAVVLCLCGCGVAALRQPEKTSMVLSHVSSGFEIDDTLGRLQFVSNLLPESAMVFLTSNDRELPVFCPTEAEAAHVWSQAEPWLEYPAGNDVSACQAGEVMTVIGNRQGEYTVRVMHENGYESIYSGLCPVAVMEGDTVAAGQRLGTAKHEAAFELRKDGISICPDFSARE